MSLFAGFWEHIEELRARFVKCVVTFMVIFGIVVSSTIRTVKVWGMSFAYIYPDPFHNVAIMVFNKLKSDFLPANARILNLDIGDSIFVQLEIALLISLILSFPMIVYQISKFISPALRPREKNLARKILVPSTVLFIAGVVFCYLYILPFTFAFIFIYMNAMGVENTVSISSFITFIILFLAAFGVIFDLPVVMAGLTWVGMVRANTWLDNLKWAFVGALIFGAVITPDSSGVTMLIVAMPMVLLYLVGYGGSLIIERRSVPSPQNSPRHQADRAGARLHRARRSRD